MQEKYILGRYSYANNIGNNNFLFGAGSKQHHFEEKEKWENVVLCAGQWLEKKTVDQAYSAISSIVSLESFNDAFHFLISNNFLVPADTSDNIFTSRYSRSHLHYQSNGAHPEIVQNNLSKKDVVIIGCGGIGNHVSAILATSGIGKLILVDNDTVEITNLTRQILFTEKDVGQSKTNVLKRELTFRNSEIDIDELSIYIMKKEDINKIPKADLWVISADEPEDLIFWINEWCVKNQQAYVNAGYVNDIAVIGPFYIPNKTGCFECCSTMKPSSKYKESIINDACIAINNNFKVSTFPPVNAISAAMCANEIIKYLGQYDEPLSMNRRLGIWSSAFFIEERSHTKNVNCKICGIIDE